MSSYNNRIIAAMKGKNRLPLSARELAKKLGVKKAKKDEFLSALADLIKQGTLLDNNGRYTLADNLKLTPGEIVKVNATFGFATPAAEGQKDVFIPGRMLLGAMPGDLVLMKVTRSSGQLPEGQVVKITQPSQKKFSGVLQQQNDEWVIIPDSYVKFPLKIHRDMRMGAEEGEKVIVRLERRGTRHSDHLVRVLERFGNSDSADSCCKAILAGSDIVTEFSAEVLEQAQSISALTGIHPKELAARLDLRDQPIFTIDGADSKDLDDAISIKQLENGWELGVHIADVSYFVTHQSPMDIEAFTRGTSVYYADSVIPMLPPELSNGICSLNPNEDRLAFSALMRLDQDGALLGYRFAKTVICSRVKGVYSEVNAILDATADQAILDKYAGLVDQIHLMDKLAAILTKRRYARGGMHLESVESKIYLDKSGKACDIKPRERGISEQIIEEFMLSANQSAAQLALEKGLPFVYRTHEHPAPDKTHSLYETLDRLGIPAKRSKGPVTTAQLAEILTSVAGTPAAPVVNMLVLRSMAKAKYSERNVGHFGLALEDYTHFTSPIRRYPDLTIHRILSGYVTGMKMENIQKRYSAFVQTSAAHSTEREIAAMVAERNCVDCYKAEYMVQFVGEEYAGIIVGATAFGVYVQLENTVEGLVSLRDMATGEWEYDGSIALVERQSGARLQLGDKVHIKVMAARVSAGQIDFALVER